MGKGNSTPSRVRIIAGQWRGRWVEFYPLEGLRPTGDRVRETLFNWLQPRIVGARCLDLFAGSGALGFEAASRGAAQVVMVERNAQAVAQLRSQAHRLGANAVEVRLGSAIDYLEGWSGGPVFDIVFLDPPFASDLLDPCIALLGDWPGLAPDGWCYVEHARGQPPHLPNGWWYRRQGEAGAVGYGLIEHTP